MCDASPGRPGWIDSSGFALVETLVALAIAGITIGTVTALISEAARRVASAEHDLRSLLETRKGIVVATAGPNVVDRGAAPEWSDGIRFEMSLDSVTSEGGIGSVTFRVRGLQIDTPGAGPRAEFIVLDMWPE